MMAIVLWREGTLRVPDPTCRSSWRQRSSAITLNQICYVYALTNTGASDVALLGATGPIITALLATAVGLERLGRRHWLSVAIGMAGVVLIVGGSASGGPPAAHRSWALASHSVPRFFSSASAIRSGRCCSVTVRGGSRLRDGGRQSPAAADRPPLAPGPGLRRREPRRMGLARLRRRRHGVMTNMLYFTAIGRVGPSRAAVFGYLQFVPRRPVRRCPPRRARRAGTDPGRSRRRRQRHPQPPEPAARPPGPGRVAGRGPRRRADLHLVGPRASRCRGAPVTPGPPAATMANEPQPRSGAGASREPGVPVPPAR